MGFQQGLSGLNAASKYLDAIGNNVSNSNTVGFKSSATQFSDVFASALTGAGGSQVGIGTKVSNISQQFTQGNITSTNNPLDVAINGQGFFRMNDNGTVVFSRSGQFQLDKNGYIVNSTALKLTGYPADSMGAISGASPVDLQISTADLIPTITSAASGVLNLDSGNPTIGPATSFNSTVPASYNSSTSMSVFDSLGNAQTYTLYFQRTTPAVVVPPYSGSWNVYATVTDPSGVVKYPDGTIPSSAAAPAAALLTTTPLNFNTSGQLVGFTAPTQTINAAALGTGAADLSFTMDFRGTTQFGSSFGVTTLTQNGNASGKLTGFNIAADGTIKGRYNNGKSLNLGQVVLANFSNPQGLQPLGNSAWAETGSSGAAIVGIPTSGNLGILQSSAVEDSNVDLTAELVNMITAQRTYQANAQTIKTQDQVMQTLVNLR